MGIASSSLVSSDFLVGVLATLGLVWVYQVWKLTRVPSVASIEARATQALPHLGDNDKITVYGFQQMGHYLAYSRGVSDMSPFVARVEAYLRLIQQPYEKRATKGLMENPRRKVPFANVKGCMVDDSGHIVDTIKNTFLFSVTVDDGLTEQQHATGYLVQKLLFASLYWVLLHHHFNTIEGRASYEREFAKEDIPGFVRPLICKYIFRSQNVNLYGAGIGRMSHADIVKMGQHDLRTLACLLGKQEFLLGTKSPTSYDCDVYAFLASLFYDVGEQGHDWITDMRREQPKLVKYVDRMRQILYPEL